MTIDREMKSGVRGFKLNPDQLLVLSVLGSPKLNSLATQVAAWSAVLNRIIAFTFVSLYFHWSGLIRPTGLGESSILTTLRHCVSESAYKTFVKNFPNVHLTQILELEH